METIKAKISPRFLLIYLRFQQICLDIILILILFARSASRIFYVFIIMF